MGDNGFDPCECIYTHEQAMQRLISLLRHSQAYCVDNECFQEGPGPQGLPPNTGDFNFFLFLMGWTVIALALYFLRPSRLRSRGNGKPRNDQGPGRSPPDMAAQ